MVASSQSLLADEIAALRSCGGYFPGASYGLIEVYGPDCAKFLQSQTTNDVLKLEPYTSQPNCLLDRKAHIKAAFQLFRRHDSFRIIAEIDQIAAILAHLEEYKFNAKVEFLDLSETGSFFVIQGPQSPKVMRQALGGGNQLSARTQENISDAQLWGMPVHVFRYSITGENGFFLWNVKSQWDEFYSIAQKTCLQLGLIQLSNEALKISRLEAGLPVFGLDFSSDNLLPETGLEERSASYTKGCFLGQEVLARVKSHGAPTRALVGLRFAPGTKNEFPVDARLAVNEEDIAQIKTNGFSPSLHATIALAFVKREYRVPDKQIVGTINGEHVEATVNLLPFYKAESQTERAKKLYNEALKLFPSESDLIVESKSVSLLRETLDLDPLFEDAYETLGVILSKRDRLDEAIALMKKLAQLNPDSVMAHTNLSVFYVQQGKKEEAEDEKAISMSIRMRLATKQADLAKQQVEDKQKQHETTLERMQMFKQVLNIDENDIFANYGLGSCLVDLKQYKEAVPCLVKTISIRPTHTVAYVALSSAYEALGQTEDAIQTLKQGIEVASKRGDMTPLHQMQAKLNALS